MTVNLPKNRAHHVAWCRAASRWNTLRTIILCVFWLVCSNPVLEGRYAHQLSYETSRTRAMGGVSVAIADDHQAIFTNPAGLARMKDKAYTPLQLHAEMNRDYERIKDELDGLSDQDTAAARRANYDKLSRIMGKQAHLAFSNLAYYIGSMGFAGGFLYQATAETGIVRPTNPRIRVKGDIDSVLFGSLARSVGDWKDVFGAHAQGFWGVNMKFLARRTIDHEFDPRDYPGLSENDLRRNELRGATLDFDGGVIYQLQNPWRSSIGAFVGNILESEIDPRIGRLPRQYGIGVSIRPLSGSTEHSDKLLLGADLWDVTGGGSFMQRLRLGGEAKLLSWLTIQVGLRGGYPTAGCKADFGDARMEFATYGEELGPHTGDNEDRRYSLSFGFEF